MRAAIRSSLASLLGVVTLGAAGLAGAAPAQAAVSDCPSGYFCAWTEESAQGTMLKTRTSMSTMGSYGTRFGSYINRTSLIACMYDASGYQSSEGYFPAEPSSNNSWTSGPMFTMGSIKLVKTARECSQNAYPDWWSETSPKAAAFGDLDGNRKADVLVRDTAGRLWFTPGDGTGKLVGTGGWNAMNALVRHGDFSRDGKEDVIAREASTGKLWLYKGAGTGYVGSRTLIGSGGWNAMNALAGPGDLNGDGKADLIGREASTGKLWLYPGTASGGLGARKLIGSGGWNAMGALLAVGDFSGDGRPDLAAVTNERYAIDGVAGNPGWLLTYNGLGNGGFASGVRANSEWWRLNGAF